MGGFNACMLSCNQVRFIKKNLPSTIEAIVVIPNQSISTHLSRKTLPQKYSQKDAIFNLSHSTLLASAFFEEKWDLLREASMDRFHQFFRMKQIPILFEVQKTALNNGALMSTLSGSGSTFFNLCFKEDTQNLKKALNDKFPRLKVLPLKFDNFGVVFDDEFKF
ncbi:homoserine kinase family protein [Helicobacter canadensis MIT 98-5491]|nr:homoserine kinase family protein [Helicobacter canadensis MIT 98-5491]